MYEVRLVTGGRGDVVYLADQYAVVLHVRLLRQPIPDIRQVGDHAQVIVEAAGRLEQHGRGEGHNCDERDSGHGEQLPLGWPPAVHFEGVWHLATQPRAGVNTPERHGEQHVDDDHDGDGRTHGVPGGDTDALRAAACVEAVVALDS